MRITIENIDDAAKVADSLRHYLKDAAASKLGHSISLCGCDICKSAHDALLLANDLQKASLVKDVIRRQEWL